MRVPTDAVGKDAGWPAADGDLVAARGFLAAGAPGRVAIACDSDVDGLSSAVIVERTLQELGCDVTVLPARRGEHVHRESMRARIAAAHPSRLVVLDMGSRPAPIAAGVPTLVIDHHHAAAGVPPDALVVNGYDRPPVAPTSVLAYAVCAPLADLDSSRWLAALGAVADLGTATAFAGLLGVRAGGTAWTKGVSLLNAARRAPDPDAALALEVLRGAHTVHDITSGRLAGTRELEARREEVRAETERCSRVPPRVQEEVALIRFSSRAQVHPVVAIRWARRLRPRIVLAANDGYLPGRTNFAVRCDAEADLVGWLRGLPFTPSAEAEYANGHARATGGSLPTAEFERLLAVLGFGAEGVPEPRRAAPGSQRP